MAHSQSLISYFSRKGNNYLGGSIVNLPIGNTEVIAKKIQALTGSDMFHIETTKSYPEDYTETTNVAKEEKCQTRAYCKGRSHGPWSHLGTDSYCNICPS
jgi:flavodoxin